MRVLNLLARLRQLVEEIVAAEIARANARPEHRCTRGLPLRPLGDHPPGALPVLPAITHRQRRLSEHLAIEPASGQPHGRERDDQGEPGQACSEQEPRRYLPPLLPGEDGHGDKEPDPCAAALGQDQAS